MTVAAPKSRAYRQTARAEAAEATHLRIIEAATELFWANPGDDVSLDEVASRAGVSTRTVIRRFGGREGLLTAASEHQMRRVESQRAEAPVGDTEGAVANLAEHYEELGDRALRLLELERTGPRIAEFVDQGRASHAAWCERVFAPTLARLSGAVRRRRLAQLIAICDVYTWKLLRRDRGLSRRETERALVEMLEPLTKETP